MIKSGAATWAALGYAYPDGTVPYIKLHEFLVVDALTDQALSDRKK